MLRAHSGTPALTTQEPEIAVAGEMFSYVNISFLLFFFSTHVSPPLHPSLFSSHPRFCGAALSGGGVPERPIRAPAGIQLMN